MTSPAAALAVGTASTPTTRERKERELRHSPDATAQGRRVLGLRRNRSSHPVDLRLGQGSLELVMEVHRFLQKLAVHKVTLSEATKGKAVCQATLQEANIWA